MSNKEKVIAKMKAYINSDVDPDIFTLAAWVEFLEQDEQQTPPLAVGQPSSGESSVQPAAVLQELREELERRQNGALAAMRGYVFDSACVSHIGYEMGSHDAYRHAVRILDEVLQNKTTQIEHEAKCHAAG